MHRPPLTRLALAGALAFGTAGGAWAVEYGTLDSAASTVGFRFSQMGVTLDGQFKRFSGQLRFDPAKPEAASTTVEVPLSGIDTGTAEGNDEAKAKTWFDTAAHPVARFVSSGVKPLGANRYEVAGELTIKGNRRAVSFPVTYTPGPSAASFDGSLTLNRTDFGIGEGEWSSAEIVAHKVEVVFHLVAKPLAP
ncbi:YceI family protein [Denitromonas iodatirespirans]|uniref:YceI family protein n=1 Tax=Denitromonas iodatirespirans TaxID=2795389 RepID=A0A944H6E0_DENI1|nr:YceI family protein [Denitromonas iodatirespirans]MBT0960068.1 YceI family protein [Denitromonas iodatirespirans]